MGDEMDPPTAEQCTAREFVEIGGRRGIALWWPQMGGYVGKAVIFADPGGGADVLVWHDGEFPFDGTCPNCGEERRPARIYVTDPGDWARFGRDAELALENLLAIIDREAAGGALEADVLAVCRGCGRGTRSVECPRCAGPACAECRRCPACADG